MHSMQRLRLRVPYQKFLDEALTKAEEEICAEKEISREKYLASVKKFDDEKNRDVACRLEV